MAKRDLLPSGGQFYKANLHCHSTLSDGRLTPAELKAAYKAAGYSILCITDHELLLNHSDLNDPDFLMLTGYELSVNDTAAQKPPYDWPRTRTCHINLYSPKPDYTKYACFDPAAYSDHTREALNSADVPEKPYTRVYSGEGISDIVRIAHETGFLCSYNHPTWSLETEREYLGYRGFDMMEVVNYGCVIDGYDEYNGHAYEAMLRAGRRLSCSATDDNHNVHGLGDPLSDSFGGYVWLKMPELSYEAAMEALRWGDFYACAGGPELTQLYVEDGVVHLGCRGAVRISMTSACRISACRGAAPGETLTDEAFTLTGEEGYVHFELWGADGGRTYTRAYFLDELNG